MHSRLAPPAHTETTIDACQSKVPHWSFIAKVCLQEFQIHLMYSDIDTHKYRVCCDGHVSFRTHEPPT